MRRLAVPAVIVAVAIGLLVLLAFGVSHQGVNTSLDSSLSRGIHPLPPNTHMALPVLGSSGHETLTRFRGKIVVVNVFASWCSPCRAEAPILDREQRILAQHDGTVVGVTYKDDTGASESFVHQEHISYPVLRDVSGTFSQSWGINGVPETFIINRQGRVVALRRYELGGTWLQQTVAPLLTASS
ncbi:MAG TPA: TlpA disulfide reductase family protein [Solirubrobacteraceae bacterium]|nr:TlpA disulfide reductase family protein [Solirubrobacteraceae bacterium]